MWIVNLVANQNGSHNDHRADHITTVPEGWAMIPDDFTPPSSFHFVDIMAEEVTYTREVEVEKEVTRTREVESLDEDGDPITITEEYKEMERVTEECPYTMMTVIAMTEGEVPPAPEPEPTAEEKRDAQIFYTAMMTDTLLEEVYSYEEQNR